MDIDEIKSVTESLYKQGRELAVKNTTLALLSKLYEFSILSLSPKELADKICSTIQKGFSFELVSILNYAESQNKLTALSLFKSDRLKEVDERLKIFSDQILFEQVSLNPFFSPILLNKKTVYTENIKEVWGNNISAEAVKIIEEDGHIRSSLFYPLITEEKTIGILVIALNRGYDKLFDYEREAIQSITNVTSVALDKAFLYEKLQTTNEELAKSNGRQENLLHFISHQIKGYLTKSEAAFAGIIEGDYGEPPPSILELSKAALSDSRAGVETVQGILNASNLKKGTVVFDKTSFDFKKSTEEYIEQKRSEATAKDLSISIEIKPAEYNVVGDKEKLEKHVIANLIDNAIKYTLRGGLKIAMTKDNGKILFSVKDTGVGILEEDKKKLFTEGGKGKESSKFNVDSTGYGLFIAKGVVEAHGGRIWAESEGQGKGATFYVELPAGN